VNRDDRGVQYHTSSVLYSHKYLSSFAVCFFVMVVSFAGPWPSSIWVCTSHGVGPGVRCMCIAVCYSS
jgi:hypothetical protein